jgi:hypothetical protein
MTVDCRQREFLDYHGWSMWAREQVEAGIQIPDEQFDLMRDHNAAVRQAERREQMLSGPWGRA